MTETVNNKLFLKYQDGDIDIIVDIIELERAQLFDYLIRMTGQHDRSLATIDEVVRALKSEELAQSFSTYEQLKIKILATARNFSQDIWNADINALENQGFSGVEDDRQREVLQSIEVKLANLPGIDRELLLLHCMYGLSIDETSLVVNRSIEFCSDRISLLLQGLKDDLGDVDDSVMELIVSIPRHPISGNTNMGTVALSQIMGDIGKVRREWAYQSLIAMVLLLALLGALYYFYF